MSHMNGIDTSQTQQQQHEESRSPSGDAASNGGYVGYNADTFDDASWISDDLANAEIPVHNGSHHLPRHASFGNFIQPQQATAYGPLFR